jgi:hypothetical protein
MAEKVIFFRNRGQLQQIKTRAENAGFRTKHIDYVDSDGNPTDGKSGRLTLTNDPIVQPNKQQMNQRQLLEFLADKNNIELVGR